MAPILTAVFLSSCLVSSILGSGVLATAAAPPTFHVQYAAEGGSYQTYLVARQNGGVAGEAWLNAQEHDQYRARELTVCDPRGDGVAVRARLTVPDGRRIEYLAPIGRRCFVRNLGYPILRWQLVLGARVSGQVPPPRLV